MSEGAEHKLPQGLGQPVPCSVCQATTAPSRLIYEGAELEPVCLDCLRRLDPIRAQILEKIPRPQ